MRAALPEYEPIENYRKFHGHNPPVTIYTDAWLDLAVLGFVAGRTYDHFVTPRRLWAWIARLAIRHLFRERPRPDA